MKILVFLVEITVAVLLVYTLIMDAFLSHCHL